jgi:hypothetical protein
MTVICHSNLQDWPVKFLREIRQLPIRFLAISPRNRIGCRYDTVPGRICNFSCSGRSCDFPSQPRPREKVQRSRHVHRVQVKFLDERRIHTKVTSRLPQGKNEFHLIGVNDRAATNHRSRHGTFTHISIERMNFVFKRTSLPLDTEFG